MPSVCSIQLPLTTYITNDCYIQARLPPERAVLDKQWTLVVDSEVSIHTQPHPGCVATFVQAICRPHVYKASPPVHN